MGDVGPLLLDHRYWNSKHWLFRLVIYVLAIASFGIGYILAYLIHGF